MFMFGTFANGKKDAPPQEDFIHPQEEDFIHPLSTPSSPLGILANDGILCWEARLHKSIVVPRSPSMDALRIHSKSTTTAADPGVSPPVSVPLLDEEKPILAAIQNSLSSVKAEVFCQGPNGGGTHLNFSATLTGLDDVTPVCVFPRFLVVPRFAQHGCADHSQQNHHFRPIRR